MYLTARMLAKSILSNKCIDGSAAVLRGEAVGARDFVPPVAKMAAEIRAEGTDEPSTRGRGRRTTLTVSEFETLSLRARAAVLDDAELAAFPVVKAEDLLTAIAEIAEKVAYDDSGARKTRRRANDRDPETERLLSRRGLQIIGCRITGDVVLVNARLPFSVRFVGCVIEGAVVVDHCGLTTLDLSGSVVRGVHASFLNAAGSVRMRRTLSTGPVDLGGARIRGLFDASDCIVIPVVPPPQSEVFVGDRGAFNLSLTTLENEFRCERARIYGGINMKGATVQGSVFLNESILLSPVGVRERLLSEICARERIPLTARCETAQRQDVALARRSRGRTAASIMIDRETMQPYLHRMAGGAVFVRLVHETVRAATAALRADGIRVEGSIFARRLLAAGRVRMKYARVGGGLHLNGSHLRCVQDIEANTDALSDGAPLSLRARLAEVPAAEPLLAMRRPDQGTLSATRGERTQDALDLRDCVIAGALTLQTYQGNGTWRPTNVRGVIALSGAQVAGDIQLQGVHFRRALADGEELRQPALYISGAQVGGSVNLSQSRGLFGLLGERLEAKGGLFFTDKIEKRSGKWPRRPPRRAWKVSGTIDLTNARLGADVTLVFDADYGPQLDLQHAEIQGRLTIAPAVARYQPEPLAYEQDVEVAKAEWEATRQALVRGEDIRPRTRVGNMIDLRHARAHLISHSPTAWPAQHGLLLGGFRYEGYRGVGPLVIEDDIARQLMKPREQEVLLRIELAVVFVVTMVVCLRPFFAEAFAKAGNLNLALLGVLMAGTVVSSIMRLRSRKVVPMALHWLALQRPERHPARLSLVWPLEPYVRAARVLRVSGDHVAANRVELEHLRLRERMQDWTSYFMGKLFLKLVNLVARYGYGLGRTVVWVLFTIIIAAGCFEYAHRERLMQPNKDAGGGPRFVSLVYATDLVVPFVGLAHEEEWRPASPCPQAIPTDKVPSAQAIVTDEEPCLEPTDVDRRVKAFIVLEWAFRGLGLLLSSIIVVAITARAEVMFAKIDD